MNKPGSAAVPTAVMKWFIFSLSTAVFVLPLWADPAWKGELTSPTLGNHPLPISSVVNLQVSWKGMIESGNLRIEFAPPNATKAGTYVVRASASSVGAAALLFPYQGSFWAELDPTTLRPILLDTVELDQKERVHTTVKYLTDRIETHEESKRLKTGVTKPHDHTFNFAPVFDIFSAMLHVRSQKLDDGDLIAIVVCPFSTPYILKVKVQAHEVHNGSKAIRLSIGMQKINRDTLELQDYKKLKKDATLWLSDDDERIPVEFRAAVFIGDVRATLVNPKNPAPALK